MKSVPERFKVKIRNRDIIQLKKPHLIAMGSPAKGLVVLHEHKQNFWDLFSAVNGRIKAAYPHGGKLPLSRVFRDLEIMPDKTSLTQLADVLRGKKPIDLKKIEVKREIVRVYLQLKEHRDRIRERIKTEGKVPWHTT